MPSDEYFEYAKGGLVPSESATTDAVPAVLLSGYILPARLAQLFGHEFLNRLNNSNLDYLFDQRD